MGKFSPRTLLWGIFCVWVTVFLYGCVQPLSLDSFVKDDEVQEIVEKSAGTVYITQDSVPGLIPGNKKISGLSLDKYYIVEEWDDTGDSPVVKFITANGKLSENLTDIGKVTVREIGDLNNTHRYRIITTEALPGDVSYTALNPPDSAQMAKNTGGLIKLPAPEDEKSFVIYTLTPPQSLASCEIIEVHFSSASASDGIVSRARLSQDGDIITLIDKVTVTDYIFFRYVADKNIIDFFILRVASDKVEDPEMPGEEDTGDLKVTVNFTLSAADKTFTLNPSTISFSQADFYSANAVKVKTIGFNDTAGNPFDAGSIKWTYNKGLPDEITWDGANMTIDFNDVKYIALLVEGQYTISVEATASGVVYGSSFILEITK